MNAEEIHRVAKTGVHGIADAMKDPSDDWEQTALLGKDDTLIAAARLEWGDDEGKNQTIVEIADLVKKSGATAVAFVFSAWVSQQKSRRPSEAGDRKEILVISSIDARGSVMELAEIIRDPMPRLAAWEKAEGFDSVWLEAVRPAIISNTASLN